MRWPRVSSLFFVLGVTAFEGLSFGRLLLQVLQTGSNDVKVLAALAFQYIAKVTSGSLDDALLKLLIPALLSTTREKNTSVRGAAESAIVSVIRLREGEDTLQVRLYGDITTTETRKCANDTFAQRSTPIRQNLKLTLDLV